MDKHPTRTGIGQAAAVYRALLAAGYLALGIWAAWTEQWHSGRWLYPEGIGGLPDVVPQALSLALVMGWLVYGLAWPVRMTRPWAWAGLGLFQLLALVFSSMWLFAIGLTAMHLFAFDPRWLKRVDPAEPEAVFYDGGCGLCHRWVKRLAAADHDGTLFYFAPLDGNTAERVLTLDQRNSLPDSVVVRTGDGRVLSKSLAVLHLLNALGGWYRLGALLMRLIPRPARDLCYDAVAKVRHRLFAKPSQTCPLMPEELRGRFKF